MLALLSLTSAQHPKPARYQARPQAKAWKGRSANDTTKIARATRPQVGSKASGRGSLSDRLTLGGVGYAFTRSPEAADLSMAAMTSWRSTASAKSGTVRVPLSVSAANAA
jgi:hypothetical protein